MLSSFEEYRSGCSKQKAREECLRGKRNASRFNRSLLILCMRLRLFVLRPLIAHSQKVLDDGTLLMP